MVKDTEKAKEKTQTEATTKVNMKKISHLATALSSGVTVKNTQENGKMDFSTAKAQKLSPMALFTMGRGILAYQKALVSVTIRMAAAMKALGTMVSHRAMDSKHWPTVRHIKVTGKMAKLKATD